jgi:hypothetical protein
MTLRRQKADGNSHNPKSVSSDPASRRVSLSVRDAVVTTSVPPCTCFGACQADRACARLPRFQVYLDTAAQDARHPRIRRNIEACATHLGAMVVAMATWAHGQDLTNVDLIVLTIEPPLGESYSGRRHPHHHRAQSSGFVFSVVHLGKPETTTADVTVGGSGVRTLMSPVNSYDVCGY